jgi:hypothetical protein
MNESPAEALDRLLDDPAAPAGSLAPLAAMADEIRFVLGSMRLSDADRARLYTDVLRRSGTRSWMRSALRGWRAPAIVGGGLVTAGAVAAVAVAIMRGRRHLRLAVST